MLPIDVFNSLTRKKESLVPLEPGKIKFYVCGVTVYDDCHLGHARAMVAFDVVVRFLKHAGYEVTYVRNITDIDDKIIKRALEKNMPISELTQYYTQSMHDDAQALGCLSPNYEPRATAYISKIIQLIERLVRTQHAYLTDTGDVCFDVKSFNDYGKLSKKDIEGLISGARVGTHEGKRAEIDFVLWKRAKPGEPAWPSPWGDGRPGWHIECSAMAMDTLGEAFDIHGGGLDLQFPHHENEIAQSEAATGKTFARYWMHVGMLNINQEKMSKSLGNFFTIKDMLKRYSPEVLRFFLLSSHYRSALNFSKENLNNAQSALERIYLSLRGLTCEGEIDTSWVQQFNVAMQDDFNTPEALSVVFQLSRAVNKTRSETLAATLKYLCGLLGILQQSSEAYFKSQGPVQSDLNLTSEFIESQILARSKARQDKDFSKADEIRDMLQNHGIVIEDTAQGTIWRKLKSS